MREVGPDRSPKESRSRTRLRKVVARMERLEVDRASLVNALGKFAGADEFVTAWVSTDSETMNQVEAVERGYEKIVNSLVEIADLVESEAIGQDKVSSAKADGPGRWERLAAAGAISRARADRLGDIATVRNRLQHGYGGLEPVAGREIYTAAERLLSEAPATVRDLGPWVDKLWPDTSDEPRD